MSFGLHNAGQIFQRFNEFRYQGVGWPVRILGQCSDRQLHPWWACLASVCPFLSPRRGLPYCLAWKVPLQHLWAQFLGLICQCWWHLSSWLSNFLSPILSSPGHSGWAEMFLGLINFYHHFLSHAAVLLHQLHVLCQVCPASAKIDWTPDAVAAFDATKWLLTDTFLLAHPVASTPLCISYNASDSSAGTVLEQCVSGTWSSLWFFSHFFLMTEAKYSTVNHDLLAAYLAIWHFQPSIKGHDCVLLANHEPLIHTWL